MHEDAIPIVPGLSVMPDNYNAKAIEVWQLIRSGLRQSGVVMLMYVLESNGSSPGRQGFSMAVTANGEMAGSIGGGIMEHKLVEMAKEHLRNDPDYSTVFLRKQVHDKAVAKDQSGMICSGDQTIAFCPLCTRDLATVEKVFQILKSAKNGIIQLSPAGLTFSEEAQETGYNYQYTSAVDWLFEAKTGPSNHLYIVGAGHCALALTKLMSNLDFYIHLYDDRNSLPTMEQNIYAHEKEVIENYGMLDTKIQGGRNSYVVIMTVGYRTDDLVIRAMLQKQLAYLGVLGSKKKIEKLFSDYIAEGISKDLLDNIRAPIGLDINSRTPEEIAISIAAEIIQVKNR
ncbi:MAG: XdhC family protein [Bacteroidota bacterium]